MIIVKYACDQPSAAETPMQ